MTAMGNRSSIDNLAWMTDMQNPEIAERYGVTIGKEKMKQARVKVEIIRLINIMCSLQNKKSSINCGIIELYITHLSGTSDREGRLLLDKIIRYIKRNKQINKLICYFLFLSLNRRDK